jgi:hypothetical protein
VVSRHGVEAQPRTHCCRQISGRHGASVLNLIVDDQHQQAARTEGPIPLPVDLLVSLHLTVHSECAFVYRCDRYERLPGEASEIACVN